MYTLAELPRGLDQRPIVAIKDPRGVIVATIYAEPWGFRIVGAALERAYVALMGSRIPAELQVRL